MPEVTYKAQNFAEAIYRANARALASGRRQKVARCRAVFAPPGLMWTVGPCPCGGWVIDEVRCPR